MPVAWLWSRRLTEPPRPANVGYRPIIGRGRAKVSKGRSQSRQTGSVLWSCPQVRNPLRRGICHTPSRTTAYAPHSFVDILPLRRYNSLDRRISRRSRAVARRDARWARVKGIGCDLRTIPVTVKRTRKHSHCSIPEWEGAFEVEAKSGDLAASQHIAISWG